MALPTTISGVILRRVTDHGPFLSGGNVYIVALDSTDESLIEVWKATDPTSSFTEQDSGNKPNLASTVDSLWVHQDGTTLHIATQEVSDSDVNYYTFDMSADTWDLSESVTTSPDAQHGVSVGVRSDGDVIVAHQGVTDKIMSTNYDRVHYSRRESSSWTADVAIGNAGAELDHRHPIIVEGASDRMHIFYHERQSQDGRHRSLSSSNGLDTDQEFETSLNTIFKRLGKGISYESGGTIKVRLPYLDSNGQASVAKCDSGATPTITEDTNVSDVDVRQANGSPCMTMTADGTDLYLLYSDITDSDLYYDKNADDAGWGTDIEELDAVTIGHMSANVYDRSGTKLAYVYDDAGTVKYNEIDLGGTPSGDDYGGFQQISTMGYGA